MTEPHPLPLISSGIPGTGGRVKVSPEDFRVDEIPAYTASGSGDHVLAVIRKTGISTFEAVKRLALALEVKPSDIGTAGLKDTHAVTTQQISLPAPTAPDAVLALELEDLEILSAERHGNKLRTGHLRGNRFAIRIRETELEENEAVSAATETLNMLALGAGTPNWFGTQRFGKFGDNAIRGLELVRGQSRGRKPNGRMLRLLLSALQSQLFNDYLRARIDDGNFRGVIDGDLLKKSDSGGVFVTDGASTDQPRMDRGEVAPTGPMFGPKMKQPPAESAAAVRESAVLLAADVGADAFKRYAKLTPGTRRPISVPLGDVQVQAAGTRDIEVSFTLPAGSYATSVLREVTKTTD